MFVSSVSLGKSLNLNFFICQIGIIRGLLCGLNELIHTMFLIVFLALSKQCHYYCYYYY